MVITRLIGGLGNQLFQYAAGRAIALRHGVELKLDLSAFDTYTLHAYSMRNLSLRAGIASAAEVEALRGSAGLMGKLRRRLDARRDTPRRSYLLERHFHFDSEILRAGPNVLLDGFWQSEKYFADQAQAIRAELAVATAPEGMNAELLAAIKAGPSASLHVRRADYVSDAATQKVHGSCSLAYYQAAVAHLAERVADLRLFVFSDDPAWAKANLRFPLPLTVVEGNGPERNYEDLRLMSSCGHNIIANSTFSWWGAWLNANPGRIVCAPRQWFQTADRDTADLIPDAWVRL